MIPNSETQTALQPSHPIPNQSTYDSRGPMSSTDRSPKDPGSALVGGGVEAVNVKYKDSSDLNEASKIDNSETVRTGN